MPNIRIRNVPAETYRILHERAAAAHQSLQEYLRSLLIREAWQPMLNEVLDAASTQQGGRLSLIQAAAMVPEDRDRR